MKKSLLISAITFVIGLGLGYLFFNKPQVLPQEDQEDVDISSYGIGKCDGTIDRSSQLCLDSAYQIVQGYKGIGLDLKQNTRAVWLPFSRIENLYFLLKNEQEKMGTDGLRIYFGRYPKEYEPGKRHPHAKQNTLLFVSTKSDSVKTKEGLFVKIHRDYFNQVIGTIPENKGELCPPGDCPGSGALLLGPPSALK